jgi:hypothetical protein
VAAAAIDVAGRLAVARELTVPAVAVEIAGRPRAARECAPALLALEAARAVRRAARAHRDRRGSDRDGRGWGSLVMDTGREQDQGEGAHVPRSREPRDRFTLHTPAVTTARCLRRIPRCEQRSRRGKAGRMPHDSCTTVRIMSPACNHVSVHRPGHTATLACGF